MNFYDFCNLWHESRKDQFSYEGKKALFEYLEGYEESTGEEIEFDCVALCCEYTEYENLEELKKSYNHIDTLDDLREHTTVIEIEGSESFIIQNY